MQPRRARARLTPYCRAPLFCAALTLYSTWPCAQGLARDAAPALKSSWQLSPRPRRAVQARTPKAQPLALKLSRELSGPREPPSPPLPLKLAMEIAIVSPRPGVPEPGRRTPIDQALAQPVIAAIRVNGQDFGTARVLRMPDGRWLARRADLEEWRLQPPNVPPVMYAGEEHFALDAFAGVTVRFNEEAQELAIDLAAKYFAETTLQGMPATAPQPVPPPLGAFLNYDLFLTGTSGTHQFGGLFEAAVFSRYGVTSSTFLAQDNDPQSHFIRLETSWRRDFPNEMKTLVVGDTIGSSGIWGRPVRFGGLRYGTNFATRPGFITFPLPALRGEAALPTVTDLYVDGILRQSSNVPPGPFRITNLPVVTGQGDVRLVVRDLLGREQVISVPYYASSLLLREGLVEDSGEIGFVRKDFGLKSDDYGRFLATLQRRKGFTDRFTGEARAEILRDQQTLGIGGSYSFPTLGIFTIAGAASHSERGGGELAALGFERQVRRGLSFGVRSQWTSEHFAQLGFQPDERAPLRIISANVGYAAGGYGSLGAGYIRQDNRDTPGTELVSVSYSMNLTRRAALILFGLKPISGAGTAAGGVTLSMGFGERSSASASFTGQAHASEGVVQVQQNLPVGPGFGYRFLAGGGARGDREEAGVSWQTDKGTYLLEAGRADNQIGYRAGASGGVAMIGGRPYLARNLNDSFAVAHVPGFAEVGVYLNNQLIARTDSEGYAMLPRLLPYQANSVRIDTGNLPMDTQIDAVQLDAVPYYRSGLMLEFPVARANGALITLLLAEGGVMPAGSIVTIVGRPQQFMVAQRGEVYVTGLGAKNRLRATWRDQSCEFDVERRADAGPLPRIGPIECAGVKP